MKYAYQTPCGIFRCTDSTGTPLPFHVVPYTHHYHTAVYDLISEQWIPVKPAVQSEIILNTDSLSIGGTVTVRLHSDLDYHFGCSDENTICNVVTENGFSLSLGAYDPNDDAKMNQAVPFYQNGVRIGFKAPEQYDTTDFRGYLLKSLPDWSGFSLQLLDRTMRRIRFRLAWIRHLTAADIEAEPDDYENAVTLITLF